jgi:ABC-type polysaccharide/polyol phosphate transport system ATPase subunit/SAM-dependent methyltransferase
MAIRVERLSKTFLIPHERRNTLREYVLHPFRRTSYEKQEALVDVSFEVASGEFFGVVGRNGSGKSTLLKLLARIYRPDSGSVMLDGQVSPFIELGVGFNSELSGRDNIKINATLLGLSFEELEARFDEIVAFAELERFVDQKLKNYSSGMQLRLAYAIAIQVPFDILLLDEVLAVGDQNFQDKCYATFEAMRVAGKTVVLVTHSLPMITRFCDRALLLRDGHAEVVGPPEAVVETYLGQERRRAATATSGAGRTAPSQIERPVGSAAGRRGDPLSREEIALMAPQQVYEIIKTQQARLAHREERLLELTGVRQEIANLSRDVLQLTKMVESLSRRHYGDRPVPPEELRARMSPRSSVVNFLAQGLATADAVLEVFGEAPGSSVLEWGCGSGRAYRWLLSYPAWQERYHGCDPDAEAAAWAAQNLGCDTTACREEPPLPYGDKAFGGMFSVRMLTCVHPDQHRGWYAELRRVLQPGARAFVATQGLSLVPPSRGDLKQAFEREGWAYVAAEGGPPASFVSREFTVAALEGMLLVEEYREQGYGSADAYVLRRP